MTVNPGNREYHRIKDSIQAGKYADAGSACARINKGYRGDLITMRQFNLLRKHVEGKFRVTLGPIRPGMRKPRRTSKLQQAAAKSNNSNKPNGKHTSIVLEIRPTAGGGIDIKVKRS